jgi:tetratricopeptide (TPR) repeat protein
MHARWPAVVATTIATLGSLVLVAADERHLDFVHEMQQAGYYDAAVHYLNQLKDRPKLPAEVRAAIDYELGKSLLGLASDERDLVKRDQQLEEARTRLDAFVKSSTEERTTADAYTDLARILIERGRVAVIQSNSPAKKAQRRELQTAARGYFDQARTSFTEAEQKYHAAFKRFPSHIDTTKPIVIGQRKMGGQQATEQRDQARLDWMQAQLHLALIEYEYAQTFDPAGPDYKSRLTEAIKKFEDVYTRYRDRLAGLNARMWMGKCYEEMGDVRKAVGFYEELEKHDPKQQEGRARDMLEALQRQVLFFHIICMNKRGDYVLAQEAAEQWLRENTRERRSKIGLGVQMELGTANREIAKQAPEDSSTREIHINKALDIWTEVARFESAYKDLANQERAKWGGLGRRKPGKPSFEDALSRAEQARDEGKWKVAAENFEIALAQVAAKHDIHQVNDARLRYAFCLYKLEDYYPSAILCEHIATRYPDSGLALNAAYISVAAYANAYNQAGSGDRQVELAYLERMARFLEGKWGETSEADFARLTLGNIALSRRRHVEAAGLYSRIGKTSEHYIDAQTRAGEAYWQAYLEGVQAADAAAQAATLRDHLQKAQQLLAGSRAERVQKLDPKQPLPVDAARADLFLSQIYLEAGRPKEALALAEPLLPGVGQRADLAEFRLPIRAAALRSYIALDQLPQAEKVMEQIEGEGKDTAEITTLFQGMASRLKEEMERLVRLGDKEGAERARRSFVAFLDRLGQRQAGQTFDGLNWVAAAFFGLGAYDKAEGIYRRMITQFAGDAATDPKHKRDITATNLRLATSLRKQAKYAEANQLIAGPDGKSGLLAENPKALDLRLEQGRVLTWWATAEPSRWDAAIKHWKQLGGTMGFVRPKPASYHQCWVYLGLARHGKGMATPNARKTEFQAGVAELNYILKTSSDAERARPIDDSYADTVELAQKLGLAQRPQTVDQFFQILLQRLGGAGTATAQAR